MDQNILIWVAFIWSLGLILIIKNPFKLLLLLLAKAYLVQLQVVSLIFFIILITFHYYITAIILLISTPFLIKLFKLSRVHIKNKSIAAKTNKTITVLQANLNYKNKKFKKVAEAMLQHNPDLISFIEYHGPNDHEYKKLLSNKYQYQIIEPPQHPYGIGIYSRWPIKHEQTIEIRNQMIVKATMTVKGELLKIIAVHPYPPLTRRQKDRYNKIFNYIHELLNHEKLPTIVIGDFNAVPWYPNMIELVQNHNLNYAASFWQTTFPVWLPGLRIPIDNILTTNQLKTGNTQRIRLPGSDHFGLKTIIQY